MIYYLVRRSYRVSQGARGRAAQGTPRERNGSRDRLWQEIRARQYVSTNHKTSMIVQLHM